MYHRESTHPYLLEVVSSLHVDSHGRKHNGKLLLAFFFPVLWPKEMSGAVQVGVSSAIRQCSAHGQLVLPAQHQQTRTVAKLARQDATPC